MQKQDLDEKRLDLVVREEILVNDFQKSWINFPSTSFISFTGVDRSL